MEREKPSPSYAPVYAAMYPELVGIVKKHGYALAPHGSLQRDFDLVCIPWVAHPSTADDVVKDICSAFALNTIGIPTVGFHGRKIYTLSMGFGECFLDLSFMPLGCD